MILETTPEDHDRLSAGKAPRSLHLADSAIAPPEILQMLGDVAAGVREGFSPCSWLVVDGDELVGLCSITRPPAEGVIDIGYGIAPTRHGRGIAGRAIGEIVGWARADERVAAITADTAVANIASQRVLERNGFGKVGERTDEEDGPLICWRIETIARP